MGELKVKVSEKTEKSFRQTAMKKYGYGKGSLSMAADKALSEWSKENEGLEGIKTQIKDPVLAIRGMLKGVTMSSVELQHRAGDIRAKRYAAH